MEWEDDGRGGLRHHDRFRIFRSPRRHPGWILSDRENRDANGIPSHHLKKTVDECKKTAEQILRTERRR